MPGIQYPIAHLPMLGKGSILFDLFDASGNPTGYQHLGNATKFEVSPKDDRAELYQSLNKSSSLIANALKKRTVNLAIVGTDFSADHMALALMASGKTTQSISAGAVTAETLASATAKKKGRFLQFSSRSIDPSGTAPVIKQGATTFTAGTDYVLVDPVEGLLYIPTTSTIDDAVALTADYHTLVAAFSQVAGVTQPQLTGKLRFVPDPTDGQKIGVEAWRVNLFPSGQIGLIADDYGNWTLDGVVLDDTANHPSAPYFLATFY